MELTEAIAGRRSIRKFRSDKISQGDLRAIMDAATMAPSAKNLQPWHFVVLTNVNDLLTVQRATGRTLFAMRQELSERFSNNPEIVEETIEFLESLGGAPCVVLAFQYSADYQASWESDVVQSVSAAIQNLILAAYDRDIGSCWITAPLRISDELQEEFAPQYGPLVAAIVLGFPSEYPSQNIKRKAGRVTFK